MEILKEVFGEMGVTTAFVDLDDTLVDTQAVYIERMNRVADMVVGDLQRDEFTQRWRQRIMENRHKYFVDPVIMRVSFDEIAGEIEEGVRAAVYEELRSIYEEDTPLVFDGVDEFLRDLKSAGLRVCVVTHASEEWTGRKLSANNLSDLVDVVYCIKVDGPKSEAEWAEVYEKEGVTVNRVIVVGDSISSDVWPNLKLGLPADRMVRVRTTYNYHGDEVPEYVWEVDGVGQAVEVFLR